METYSAHTLGTSIQYRFVLLSIELLLYKYLKIMLQQEALASLTIIYMYNYYELVACSLLNQKYQSVSVFL